MLHSRVKCGSAAGPLVIHAFVCARINTMASEGSTLLKSRTLVIKYPKRILTEVNGFSLSHFFSHRLGRWNKILKLARWKFMPVLALLSGKCDAGACRVLRELGWSCPQAPQCSVALWAIWLHPWIYASANQHPTLYLYFFLTSLSHSSIWCLL